MYKTFFFLLFSLTIISCAQEKTEDKTAEANKPESAIAIPAKPKRTKLIANIDYLRVRSEAGTASETVAMLKEGDIMYDLGEVSIFSTKVELRGVKYNEPWLKVETESGQTGWVFGGGVYFDVNNASTAAELLLQKRLVSFFGKEVSEQMQKYRSAYLNAQTDKALAQAYRQGVEVAEKIQDKLEKNLPEPQLEGNSKEPDMRWLESSMPGYLLGSAAEGSVYYFFRNVKDFKKKAAKTTGRADDAFAELKLLLYPEDSIEYFFPSYFIQTWDYGGHSLLGEGKHLTILTKANEVLATYPGLFDQEIDQIKTDLLHDMTASAGGYWYNKTKILSEFDAVLNAELGILTEKDMISLKEQRKHLEKPAENNIKIDIRSGVE